MSDQNTEDMPRACACWTWTSKCCRYEDYSDADKQYIDWLWCAAKAGLITRQFEAAEKEVLRDSYRGGIIFRWE